MSVRILAERSGVGLRTVQQILSADEPNATLNTVLSIADAASRVSDAREIGSAVCPQRAGNAKGPECCFNDPGTSALEAQAVPKKALIEIEEDSPKNGFRIEEAAWSN